MNQVLGLKLSSCKITIIAKIISQVPFSIAYRVLSSLYALSHFSIMESL